MDTDRQCDCCGDKNAMFYDPRQRAYKQPVDKFYSCRKCWALSDERFYKKIDNKRVTKNG